MRLRQETRQVGSRRAIGLRPTSPRLERTLFAWQVALKRRPYRLLPRLSSGARTGRYRRLGRGRDGFVLGRHGSRPQVVGEQAAELAALLQAHVDDFEGHILGAIVAHEGSSLEISQAYLKAQRDRGAGC